MLTRRADWRSDYDSSAPILNSNESLAERLRVQARGSFWRFGVRRFRAWGWCAFVSVLLCALSGTVARAEAAAKNVLVMYSTFEHDHKPLELIGSGIRGRYAGQVNYYSAFMDHERIDDGSYRERLAETIGRDYEQVKLDVVIAVGIEALQLATQYRERLFPGVPIVFVGLSASELREVSLVPGMTGVTASPG